MADLEISDAGAISAEIVLEPNPQAPARARRFLADLLPGLQRLNDASLALSELVTNAVEHVGSGFVHVRLAATGNRVRLEVVSDSGSTSVDPPPHMLPPETQERGRGLAIVGEVADRMGVDRSDRTLVWFEIHDS